MKKKREGTVADGRPVEAVDPKNTVHVQPAAGGAAAAAGGGGSAGGDLIPTSENPTVGGGAAAVGAAGAVAPEDEGKPAELTA